VVGETPNLAARLQGMAPANGLMIAEATRRLLGNLFECRDLGTTEVKGLDALVPVWQVLRAEWGREPVRGIAIVASDPAGRARSGD